MTQRESKSTIMSLLSTKLLTSKNFLLSGLPSPCQSLDQVQRKEAWGNTLVSNRLLSIAPSQPPQRMQRPYIPNCSSVALIVPNSICRIIGVAKMGSQITKTYKTIQKHGMRIRFFMVLDEPFELKIPTKLCHLCKSYEDPAAKIFSTRDRHGLSKISDLVGFQRDLQNRGQIAI